MNTQERGYMNLESQNNMGRLFGSIKRTLKRKKSIYAEPRDIKDIDKCFFYHTIDLPGHGTVHGSWDLRNGVDQYLGNVKFQEKSVLEIGTANGFLCFEMEKRGAEIIALDLSKDYEWDIVPFAQYDYKQGVKVRKEHIEKLNNAYWLCHRLFNSKAKVVYGDVYHMPDEIGEVDIVTYGSILLHLRDPFRALQNGLRFARETVIVTEPLRDQSADIKEPSMKFLPNPETIEPKAVWWSLRSEIVVRMIGVLGFEEAEVTYHSQINRGKPASMYTVVGNRTRGRTIG
jgi:SAM-dependent methyltransferase